MGGFERKKENFKCGHCGHEVEGDGYTNHCPKCLWSRHMDINPGDRLSTCGGMMQPIWVEKDGEDFAILHRCEICGHTKRNRRQADDSFEALLKINEDL